MNYSQEFIDTMNSNVRPKCEPRITLHGTNSSGEDISIVWEAKDIQSLTFKRTIDPVGRSLPTMDLQWTELYYGKLSKESMPLKYDNITKYMAISLEWEQSLSFYPTWNDVKKLFTWRSLKNLTWSKLKSNVPTVTVTTPLMFLEATPTVSGQTITWTAKDALSFLTENQTKAFLVNTAITSIPYYNPIVYLLINARAAFSQSKELWDYYTRTIDYFNGLSDDTALNHGIIIDDATNSAIMNYLSPKNKYLDFDEDKIVCRDFIGAAYEEKAVATVPLTLQYGDPTIESVTPMSQYSYKQYSVKKTEQTEDITPASLTAVGADSYGTWYKAEYQYPKYALAADEDAQSDDINRAIRFVQSSAERSLTVVDLDYSGIEKSLAKQKYVDITAADTDYSGEVYSEDNTSNVYSEDEIYPRVVALSSWFSDNLHTVQSTTPALFHWDIGEWAFIETPLWDSDKDTPFTAIGQLLESEITYNGAVKQKIVVREALTLPDWVLE